MAADKVIGPRRAEETGAWRLLRLWPVVVGVAAVVGSIYVMSDNVGDLKVSQKIQWIRISDNEKSINALRTQTQVIEYRLNSVDEKLSDQKSDLKEILREVKK